VHKLVSLELGECPVDARSIDVPEPQLVQSRDEAIAVAGSFR
jgi:hypothetical protein